MLPLRDVKSSTGSGGFGSNYSECGCSPLQDAISYSLAATSVEEEEDMDAATEIR